MPVLLCQFLPTSPPPPSLSREWDLLACCLSWISGCLWLRQGQAGCSQERSFIVNEAGLAEGAGSSSLSMPAPTSPLADFTFPASLALPALPQKWVVLPQWPWVSELRERVPVEAEGRHWWPSRLINCLVPWRFNKSPVCESLHSLTESFRS